MAADTYGDVWRSVKLHASSVPTMLVREWVNDAWRAMARVRPWGFLRAETTITIAAERAVAVTVTNGSATVTSAALFVAGDEGRQFRVGTFPIYTILTFTDVNTIVLDRTYGGDDGTPTATVFDGYYVAPANFGAFQTIADPYNQRRLAFWITQDQLSILDPTRQASDSGPRLLAIQSPSTASASLGRVRFEYWPRPTAARSYPAIYTKQPVDWTDSDTFAGTLSGAGDVLQVGALASAALWPGTADQPNPYFNMGLADRLRKEFDESIQRLALRDDDQYGEDLSRVDWHRWPLADLAYNDQALRSTDATTADFW